MKQIKLTQGGIGKYKNGKEVLNICEDLDFDIDYKFNKNSEVYFIADNGVAIKKGAVKNNKFTIPCSFLRLGDLGLKFEIVSNDGIEEFTVEKLIIMKENDVIKIIPEIEEMKETIKNYSNLVNSLEDLVGSLERKCEILTKLVGGLYDTEIKVGNDDE